MMDVKKVWEDVLTYIESKLSRPAFKTWFSETQTDLEGDMFVVWSPSEFIQEWLHVRYSKLVLEAMEHVTGDTGY